MGCGVEQLNAKCHHNRNRLTDLRVALALLFGYSFVGLLKNYCMAGRPGGDRRHWMEGKVMNEFSFSCNKAGHTAQDAPSMGTFHLRK